MSSLLNMESQGLKDEVACLHSRREWNLYLQSAKDMNLTLRAPGPAAMSGKGPFNEAVNLSLSHRHAEKMSAYRLSSCSTSLKVSKQELTNTGQHPHIFPSRPLDHYPKTVRLFQRNDLSMCFKMHNIQESRKDGRYRR